METSKGARKDKKGFWAAIWESMTKTGGCCGSGGNCSTCGHDLPHGCHFGEAEKGAEVRSES